MRYWKAFVAAIAAGVCVGIGGTVYLSVENQVIGAFLFTAGLFTICSYSFNLFTGKVCYVLQRDKCYAVEVVCIWLGNVCGTFGMASLEKLTRIGEKLVGRAEAISAMKLGDGLLSIFILAVLCNIMIYVAVDGFLHNPTVLGKYLAMFFGVVVFILAGFEHCIANVYYFTLADAWDGHALLYLAVMTLGNTVGGVLIPQLRLWLEKDRNKVA